MKNYTNLLKNLLIIILCVSVLKMCNVNRELNREAVKALQKERKRSEKIVKVKEEEVQLLREKLVEETMLIDEAVNVLNDLRNARHEVETLYVEKIQTVRTFDANKLKNYFDEELN